MLSLATPVVGLLTGDPTTIIQGTGPGTGTSMPPGVDAVLEYNGSYINVRKWIDTVLVNQIDGIEDADVRDQRDVIPQDHGETPYDSYYGGRSIVLTGKIRAHTLAKLRDMQMGLRQMFAELTEKPLIFHTQDPNLNVLIYCKKSSKIVMAEIQQNLLFERDFQIPLRASNPRFISSVKRYINQPFNWFDDFTADSSASYTFSSGAGTLTWTNGQLVPTDTSEKRLHRNNLGLRPSDVRQTIKVIPGATLLAAGSRTGATLRKLDANNFLIATLTHDANPPTLQIAKMDNGVLTVLGPDAANVGVNMVNGTAFWLRAIANGSTVTAEFWTTDPIAGGNPAHSFSYNLAGGDIAKFGSGIHGDVGLRLIPPGTGWRYDELRTVMTTIDDIIASPINAGNFGAQPIFNLIGPHTAPEIAIWDAINNETTILLKPGIVIPGGDTWTIDIANRTMKDQNGNNKFSNLDPSSEWVNLPPGPSQIQVMSSGMDYRSGMTVYYSDTYM